MACPAVRSGEQFLASAIGHIDCQARSIGAWGFGALADPGSPVALALGGLLTIFVALLGLRLVLGFPMSGRDAVSDALRIGIVLTLATSWPAWRVLGYDLIIDGPDSIARVITAASGLEASGVSQVERLQRVDQGLAVLNAVGSGRLGVAQGDWFELGFARLAWLAGTLAPLALVRLLAGILLALAPLASGLLLFSVSRGLFEGWARALAACFLMSVMVTLIYATGLAVTEPWLGDVLARRAADAQLLDAPVEALVVTLSFAIVALGAVAMSLWIAFHPRTPVLILSAGTRVAEQVQPLAERRPSQSGYAASEDVTRTAQLAMSVSGAVRREAGGMRLGHRTEPASGRDSLGQRGGLQLSEGTTSLGEGYRRNRRRTSAAAARRDAGT